METRETGGVPASHSCLHLWPVCSWPVEYRIYALLLQCAQHAPLQRQLPKWTMAVGDPASLKTEEGNHPKWRRSRHAHTDKRQFLPQAQTAVTSFAAEVMLTTSSRWTYPNHCMSAGNHPCVQANTKSDNEAGPAQTTVILSYITFLFSWLKSVNIDSWTHLFYIISLFWYDSDMLTGLMSHFETRPFVSMRLFPELAFLVVFLGTEGCCRKCRNSA